MNGWPVPSLAEKVRETGLPKMTNCLPNGLYMRRLLPKTMGGWPDRKPGRQNGSRHQF
jgi:hypothetical protein